MRKKGFTMIEILIIVLIIGLLASAILVSINSARRKAKDNSFKTTAKSIQTEMVSCCIRGDGSNFLGHTRGEPICSGGARYPEEDSLGSISVGNCINGVFTKTITPGTKNSGNCTEAIFTFEDITYHGDGC